MNQPDPAAGQWVRHDSGAWELAAPSDTWTEGLADQIPGGTLGIVEIAEPEPAHAEITLADVAAALRDPLAILTPSSESTTVRIAILNQRAALDELLAALETP